MKIIRVAVYLLLARLTLADLVAAHDWWGWSTVAGDVVVGACLMLDQMREARWQRADSL